MDFPKGIRPTPTGTGLEIRIQYKKQNYSFTLATPNPHSRRAIAAAVRQRDDLKRRLKLGLPIHRDNDNATNALVGDVAQDYLNGLDVKYSTANSYVQILNQHWLPEFGHWLITDIKPSHIKQYLNKLGVSNKTKRNILVPLRNVMHHALDDELIASNPCATIRIPKQQKPPIERFTLREMATILKHLRGQAKVYFTVLFETGMRPSEALALEWSDYNGELIHINKGIVRRRIVSTTKNYEIRDVVVSDTLKAELGNHPTRFHNRHIFLNTHGGPHLDTELFNEEWTAALKKARVPYRRPYTCRHTRAGILLTAGIEPLFAAKQLGHSLEVFLRIYADIIEGMRDRDQMEKLKQLGKVGAKNWGEIGDEK